MSPKRGEFIPTSQIRVPRNPGTVRDDPERVGGVLPTKCDPRRAPSLWALG
jgi:hypothetical protein